MIKRTIPAILAALLCACSPALATQQAVAVGTSPNDGTGDTLRQAFVKLNANDAELYASVSMLTTALGGKQSLDPTLSALAAVSTSADTTIYATGIDTFATTSLTSFGRSLIGATGAAGVKTLLGLAVADVSGAAPLASPALTGTPTTPTATAGTSTTQVASTAFVVTEIGSRAVRYDAAQALTTGQKTQARANIGAAASSGSVVGYAQAVTSAYADVTAQLPFDDTVPQSSEMTDVVTVSYTPKVVGNLLHVRGVIFGAPSAAASIGGAIFQDSGTSALAARAVTTTGGGYSIEVIVDYWLNTISTSATTIRLKVGSNAPHFYVNGASGACYFGGIANSSIEVTETQP